MSETQQLEILARKDFVEALRRQQALAFWFKSFAAGVAAVITFVVLKVVL